MKLFKDLLNFNLSKHLDFLSEFFVTIKSLRYSLSINPSSYSYVGYLGNDLSL